MICMASLYNSSLYCSVIILVCLASFKTKENNYNLYSFIKFHGQLKLFCDNKKLSINKIQMTYLR